MSTVPVNDMPMLTTIDNPHDPHSDYEKWDTWDRENGYNTSSYLASIANIGMNPTVNRDMNESIFLAMWEIVRLDDSDTWVMV